MRKPILVSEILFILIILLSDTVLAGNNLSVSYSPLNTTQAMDLAVRGNSIGYLYTATSSQIDPASKVNSRPDTLKLKNPNTALLIAVVPGFVFHGSGHFYARKSLVGVALFATELVGLRLGLRGTNPFGGSESNTEGTEVIAGMILFFGSWAYDLIGAPLAVNKENEKLMGISY